MDLYWFAALQSEKESELRGNILPSHWSVQIAELFLFLERYGRKKTGTKINIFLPSSMFPTKIQGLYKNMFWPGAEVLEDCGKGPGGVGGCLAEHDLTVWPGGQRHPGLH